MKLKRSFVLLSIVIALIFISLKDGNRVSAAAQNYFYGIGVSVKEKGYASGFILSNDIENFKDGGTKGVDYTVDKILTYAAEKKATEESVALVLPQKAEISIEKIDARYKAYIAYQGVETQIPNGGTIQLNVSSATMTFDIIIRNSLGYMEQRTTVNVGFVQADSTNLFDGGNGTKDKPFLVSTAVQLNRMRNFKHSDFKLTNDIDLAGYLCAGNDFNPNRATDNLWRSIGYSETYAFGGSLDGNGKAIKNLNLSNSRLLSDGQTLENGGLFNYLIDAEIKNVNFSKALLNLNAGSAASAIVATTAKDSKFANINLEGTLNTNVNGSAPFVVNATYTTKSKAVAMASSITSNVVVNNANFRSVGGLFYAVSGYQDLTNLTDTRVIFENLTVTADLKAGAVSSGGIIGRSSGVIINNAKYNGKITCAQDANEVGGITGYASFVDFNNCESSVIIEARSGATAARNVGGIAGAVYTGASATTVSIIKDCKVTGDIILGTGSVYTGGIAGLIQGKTTLGKLTVNLGTISGGAYIGGIAGLSENEIAVVSETEILIVRLLGSLSGDSFIGGAFGRVGTTSIAANLILNRGVKIDLGRITGASYLGGVAGRVEGALEIGLAGTNGKGLDLTVETIQGVNYLGGVFGSVGKTFKLGNDAEINVRAVVGTNNYIGGIGGINYTSKAYASLTQDEIRGSTIGTGFKISPVKVSGVSYVGGFAGSFAGVLDFAGISLEATDVSGTSYAGGFAGTYYGEIKNLTLNSKIVATSNYIGGFAGVFEGIALNCDITTNLSAYSYGGGFAGSFAGSGNNNKTTALISAHSYMGGFSGIFDNPKNPVYTGGVLTDTTIRNGTSLSSEGGVGSRTAGFVGYMVNGNVDTVLVEKGVVIDVVKTLQGATFLGGIIGQMAGGSITKTTTYVDIAGNADANSGYDIGIGGMIGFMSGGSAGNNNSVYANVSGVNSINVGGVIGYMKPNATIGNNNSYLGTVTGGNQYIGGFIGRSEGLIGTNNKVNVAFVASGSTLGLFAGGVLGGSIGWFEVAENNSLAALGSSNVGVIGYLNGGTIEGTSEKHIVIRNNIIGGNYVGGFVGQMANGTIRYVDCYGKLDFNGSYNGGFVGYMSGNSLIEHCTTGSSSTLTPQGSSSYLGGFVGYMLGNAIVNNSVSRGTVYVKAIQNYTSYGGFVALMADNSKIGLGCESYGDVISLGLTDMSIMGGFAGIVGAANNPNPSIAAGTKSYGNIVSGGSRSNNRDYAGGFVGRNFGTIGENCESYGNIKVNSSGNPTFVGGFASTNSGIIAKNCKAYGVISAESNYVGGFVGVMDGGSIDASCAYMGASVSGYLVGGFVFSFLAGTFDGSTAENGYFVSNVAVTGANGAGGFAYETGGLTGGYYSGVNPTSGGNPIIKNVKVVQPITIRGNGYIGGIVAYMNSGGTVIDCIADREATIDATGWCSIGGIVGHASVAISNDSKITGNEALNNINAKNGRVYVGGIVGYLNNIDLGDGNKSSGKITILSGNSIVDAGGIVGHAASVNTKIGNNNNSSSQIFVNNEYNLYYVGGFVGMCYGSIGNNNKATGNIQVVNIGNWQNLSYAGGFAGNLEGSAGINNTASGNVYSDRGYAGGFAGRIAGTFENFQSSPYLGNSVIGEYVGGYAGIITTGTYDSSGTGSFYEVKASLSGSMGVGGFVYNFSGAALKNIKISSHIKASSILGVADATGGLVAKITAGYIENCEVTNKAVINIEATNTFTYVGGLVGSFDLTQNNNLARIKNSKASANINITTGSVTYVGGLVGNLNNANVENCETSGTILTKTASYAQVAGFAAIVGQGVKIGDSKVLVNINARSYSWQALTAGGFALINHGEIFNASAKGTITNYRGLAAGFVVENHATGVIRNSTSDYVVSADSIYCSVAGFTCLNNGKIYGSVAFGSIENKHSEGFDSNNNAMGGFAATGTGEIKGCYSFVGYANNTKNIAANNANNGPFVSKKYAAKASVSDCYYSFVQNLSDDTNAIAFKLEKEMLLLSDTDAIALVQIVDEIIGAAIGGDSSMFELSIDSSAVTESIDNSIQASSSGIASVKISIKVENYDSAGVKSNNKILCIQETFITVALSGITVTGVTIEDADDIIFGATQTIVATVGTSTLEESGVIFTFEHSNNGTSYSSISLEELRKLIGVTIRNIDITFTSNIQVLEKFFIKVTATSVVNNTASASTNFSVEPGDYVTEINVENLEADVLELNIGQGFDLGEITVDGSYAGYTIAITATTGTALSIIGNYIVPPSLNNVGAGKITITSLGLDLTGTQVIKTISYVVLGGATSITVNHKVNGSGDSALSPDIINAKIGDILNFDFALANPADGKDKVNVTITGKATSVNVSDKAYDIQLTNSGTVLLKFTSADGNAARTITVFVTIPSPEADKVTKGSYVFGEVSDSRVSLAYSGSIPSNCLLQYTIGNAWHDWNDPEIAEDGIYSLSIRFKEISSQSFTSEVFVGIIKIDSSDIVTDDIVYSIEYLSASATLVLKPIVSLSGAIYQYNKNNSGFVVFPANLKLENLKNEDTVILKITKGNQKFAVSQTIEIVFTSAISLTINNAGYAVADEIGPWTKDNVMFYLAASGNTSGLKYEYRQNGGAYQPLNSGFFNATASMTLQFKASNIYGAIAETGVYTVNIDKNVPVLSLNVPNKSDVQDEVTTTLNITNLPISGIAKLQMKRNSEAFEDIPGTVNAGKINITFTKNGDYTIMLMNEIGTCFYLNISIECIRAGSINTFEYTGLSADEWTDEVYLEFSTDSENIMLVEYSLDNGAIWYEFITYPYYLVQQNGTYIFRVTDFDGNQKVKTVEVANIDVRNPELFIEYNTTGWSHGGETIKIISLIVGASGIKSLTLEHIDNGETIIEDITADYLAGKDEFEVWVRGLYTFTLTTNAGVVISRSVDIARIDTNTTLTLAVAVESGAVLDKWTVTPFNIELSVVENVLEPLLYYYSIDDGKTWKQITTMIALKAIFRVEGNLNNTYKFKAETVSGLVSISEESYKVMIDSEKPVVKIEKDWRSKPGYVNINVTSANTASGLKYSVFYREAGSSNWKNEIIAGEWFSIKIPASGIEQYEIKIVTELGLESNFAHLDVGIDAVTPQLIVTRITGEYDSWIALAEFRLENTNNQLTGTVYQYVVLSSSSETVSADDSRWKNIEGDLFRVDFSLSGYIRFRAVSGAGLISDLYTTGYLMVDALASCEVSDVTSYQNNQLYTKDKVQLEFDFKNGGSGFNSIYIILPNGMTYSSFTAAQLGSKNFKFSLDANENGLYRIFVRNKTDITVTIEFAVNKIDRTTPQMSITTFGEVGDWTGEAVEFRVSGPTQLSGVTYWYSINGGEWKQLSGNYIRITEDTNATYQFKAVSGAGAEYIDDLYQVMIDRGAPVIELISGNRDEWSQNDILLTITAKVGGSGGWIEYSLDAVTWTKFGNDASGAGNFINNFNVDKNGTYYFRAVSSSFNYSDLQMQVVNKIDKIIPVITQNTAKDKVNIKTNVFVAAHGFKSYTVSKNSQPYNITIDENESIKFTENGTYIITFYSEGGNETIVSFTINKPNWGLILGSSGIILLFTSIIAVLVVMQIKNKRALRRLIAASTVSDDPNRFVLFKKI